MTDKMQEKVYGRFLRGKEYQELTRNGNPAWQVKGLGCFWLDGKVIRKTDFRRLVEMGYYLKSERGVTRGWKATEKPIKSKEEKELQAQENEELNEIFWIQGGRINYYHGPTRATMLLGSIK